MTTPWDSIPTPGNETAWKLRSATARFSLYHGRDSDGFALLLFEFVHDHADILHRLPRIAGIDIDYRRFSDPRRHGVRLKLLDADYVELFSVLCDNLAETIEPIESERQAVLSFLNRLERWQQLLASGARGLLRPEEIRGLVGELLVLEELLSGSGLAPEKVVSAWTGPSGAAQDFRFPGQHIEVKATGGASSRNVQISSEFQLDTEDAPVCLAVCHLPSTDDATTGLSLNQLAGRISQQLKGEARGAFETRLATAGYVEIADYDTPLFDPGTIDCFEIRDDFPCLVRGSLHESMSGVRYDLDIVQLSEFRMSGLPEVTG